MKYLMILLLLCTGCGWSIYVPSGTMTSDAVTDDESHRNFVKVWHFRVTSEVQMTVTSTLRPWLERCDLMGCGYMALSFDDELKQVDGKRVSFDCENVAEKILDRGLVPAVESACVRVHDEAISYWKANNDPKEFTDSDGFLWRRQPK